MIAMFLMPNAPLFVKAGGALTFGVVMLALMDGSFNVTFQPFRALVADMTPEEQRKYLENWQIIEAMIWTRNQGDKLKDLNKSEIFNLYRKQYYENTLENSI